MTGCEACEERLLDLLYEEEGAADLRSVRAHLEGCETCRASHARLVAAQRLATYLPELEPPRSVDATLLAAARAKAGADKAGAAQGAGGSAEAEEGLWPTILRWVGGFASGPQVAMATIMLLVVAIGLWYFPERDRTPEATGGTVMSPSHQGEAGPSATLAPAAPLELDIDPRTGRVRRRGGDGEEGRPQEALAGAQASDERPAGGAAGGDPAAGVRRATERDDAPSAPGGRVLVDELAETEGALARDLVAGDTMGSRSMGSGGGAAQLSPLPAEPASVSFGLEAPARQAAREERAPVEAPAPAPASPTVASSARAPAAQARGGAAAPMAQAEAQGGAPPIEPSDRYARGITRYQRGDYRGATDDLEAVVQRPSSASVVPDALFHLARSHRRAGQCGPATTHYQSYLARFPQHAQVGNALLELADCYRRLGRIGDARQALDRAERHASVAPAARRERVRLDEAERVRARTAVDDVAAEAAGQ